MFGNVVIRLALDDFDFPSRDAKGVLNRDKDKLGVSVLRIGRKQVYDCGTIP